MKTSCIILTAGRSERMNSPKAFLKFSDKENFLQHIIHVYHYAGIKDIITIINAQIESEILMADYQGVRFIRNPYPEQGRMSSLKIGLQSSKTECVFVQNIDNPFVSVNCIKQLLGPGMSADYIVPVYLGRGGHPVLLSSHVIQHIIKEEPDDSKLNEVLKKFKRADINMNDERVVLNINTPSDYEKYFFKSEVNAG